MTEKQNDRKREGHKDRKKKLLQIPLNCSFNSNLSFQAKEMFNEIKNYKFVFGESTDNDKKEKYIKTEGKRPI